VRNWQFLEEYAGRVEKAQQAIRNLCNRLGSIGGIAGTFFEFLEGHGLDEVQEIADEIMTVIGQFGRRPTPPGITGIQQAERDGLTVGLEISEQAFRRVLRRARGNGAVVPVQPAS
jgi:hypothetical protein